MAVTSLWTDAADYCRYVASQSLITVTGALDGGSAGQPVSVALVRDDVYGTVATELVTASGTAFTCVFNLNGAAMNDVYGLNRAISGDYTVQATQGGVTLSAPLTVSVVSVRDMRVKWCYGQTLYATEVVLPVAQPRVLPAVLDYLSSEYLRGVYPLVYAAAGHTFSLGGGTPVAVTPSSGMQQIFLPNNTLTDWAAVTINTALLPGSDTSETVILDKARMTDRDILEIIRLAQAQMEIYMGWQFEPKLWVSERLAPSYPLREVAGIGAGFYGTFRNFETFPTIELPLAMLQQIVAVQGWFNQQSTLTLPGNWMQANQIAGEIELVPTSGQSLALIFSGFPIALNLNEYINIPQFWQYAVIAGLADLWSDRAIVREAIAKAAAITILIQAGGAYKAGVSSESTSRDGVSSSRSYTSSAQFGPFAHFTLPYGEWLDTWMPRMKRSIGGFAMTTLM